jgi:hypothetical protein
MPRVRKVIREVDDNIVPDGGLPANQTVKGSGVPERSDQVFNGTTRKEDKLDTGSASTRTLPEPVKRAVKADVDIRAGEAEEEYEEIEGSELPDDNPQGEDSNLEQAVVEKPAAGPVASNGDSASEARHNRLYHARVQKAESTANRGLRALETKIRAKKLRLEESRIDAEILRARESARPRLNVMSKKTGFAKGKVSALEAEVSKPSAWLRAVQQGKNVSATYVWPINKEQIFESYHNKGIRSFDSNDDPIITRLKGSEADLGSITGPVSTDFMRIMSEQVLVLPNSKVVTPIRQFCETKILPAGTREAFFFDFGDVTFQDIVEADSDLATATPASAVIIRSAGTETNPRGARITIGYQQTEESPIDIIASANRAFALESINDESKQVMTAYNTDSGSSGDASNRKAIGGGTKTGRWVDGNSGAQITADASGLGVMKYQGLLNAKGVIQDFGLDDSNLITYTSGKAIRDLTLDADLDSYIGFSKPAIITEATVERIAGTNLVRSSAVADGTQASSSRSVMFIPNVAFGLVSGRDLTMEAQRRNELQAIHITGTQKIAGLVKNVEGTCRLSHI